MIITCEACSTKFNLDETILKKDGSKVRCTICKHIFTAYPPADQPIPEKTLPLVAAQAVSSQPIKTSPPSSTPTDIPISPSIPPPTAPIEIEAPQKKSDNIALDDDVKIMTEAPAPQLSLEDELSVVQESNEKKSAEKTEITALDVSLEDELEMPVSPLVSHDAPTKDLDLDLDLELSETDDFNSSEAPPSDTIVSTPADVPGLDIDLDPELSVAQDFKLSDDPQPIMGSPSPTNGPELELDLDLSLEEDAHSPEPETPQALDLNLDPALKKYAPPPIDGETSREKKPYPIDAGGMLDIDFSLEDDTPKQDPSDIEIEEGVPLDLDFSDDTSSDAASPFGNPEKQLSSDNDFDLDLSMENTAEDSTSMDLDFSMDDLPGSDETELSDLDFSIDETNAQNDGELELDFDFSDDGSLDSPNFSSNPEEELAFDDDLDLDFSMDDDNTDDPSLDLDFSMDDDSENSNSPLDLDFSLEETSPKEKIQNADDTLEFELEEDGEELDFDFSDMEDPTNGSFLPSTEDDEDTLEMESSTAMDLDFSTDAAVQENEISPNDEDFGEELEAPDYDEFDALTDIEQDNEELEALAATASAKQATAERETTLSGERPHLYYDTEDKASDKRSFGLGKLLLMSIFLFIVAIAGYAGAIMTGVEIPYVSDIEIPFIDQYIPKPTPPPVKLTPIKKSIVSKFLDNKSAGPLFVVRGDVLNLSQVSCRNVKLQGTLIGKDKKNLNTQLVLCGKTIPDDQLESLDMKTVMNRLTTARNSPAFEVAPGKKIPFLLVFSNLPDNLVSYNMKVTAFERVPKKN